MRSRKSGEHSVLRAPDFVISGISLIRFTRFQVDMLEQNQKFLNKADEYLGDKQHKVLVVVMVIFRANIRIVKFFEESPNLPQIPRRCAK